MGGLASFPGPKRGRKDLVSAVRACVVEFHRLRKLLIYFRTLVTPLLTLSATVRKFIIAAYGHARDSLDCTHPAADLKL